MQNAAQILLYGYYVVTPIGYFYKMALTSKDYAWQASLCSDLAYS